MKTAQTTESAALTSLLELEYAVIYGLAAGGGRLAPQAITGSPWVAPLAATTTSYDQHRLRRDRLIAALTARQVTVPVALPAYQTTRSDDARQILTFLAGLARSTIAGYRDGLAAIADPALRADAVAAVVEAARYRTSMLLAAGLIASDAAPAVPD